MREHSQRLNIKTTHLASLTAVFRSKKQAPTVVNENSVTTTDVDNAEPPHEQHDRVGGSEDIPTESAVSSETDDVGVDGSDWMEGSFVDSDSGDEFESDEESADEERDDGMGGVEVDRGTLEFELKAAEAGNAFYYT
jgi:hypothetical protein